MGSVKDSRVRGSIWKFKGKKTPAIGAYQYQGAKKLYGNDRYFLLTIIKNGKTKAFESPQAAMRAGWVIVTKGK